MHDNAAGISIFDKYLSDFHDYANKALDNIDFGENIYNVNFERDCTANDISDLISDISNHKKNKIWGRFNDEPLIFVTNLKINKNNIQIMGKNKDTIKFVVNDISYIKFKAKELVELFENIKDTVTIDVVGTANLNEWGAKITPQLFITDLEIKQEKQNRPDWALF